MSASILVEGYACSGFRDNVGSTWENKGHLALGVVTLLDVLRVHAEAYTQAAYAIALINFQIENCTGDFRADGKLLQRIHAHLSQLLPHCDELPNTSAQIKRVLGMVENVVDTANWKQPRQNFLMAIAEIQSRMRDELEARLFFGLPAARARYFSAPLDGWEEVIERFPDTVIDVEEMSKCFALSRFPGCVFHSLQIVESGVIHLGAFIGVTDPKRGWDATSKKLKALVDGGHNSLPVNLSSNFAFLEQTNQCVQAMKHAWRNKVNHVEGKLTVLRSDFTSDIAEEIMLASRAFMRRLADEMPKSGPVSV